MARHTRPVCTHCRPLHSGPDSGNDHTRPFAITSSTWLGTCVAFGMSAPPEGGRLLRTSGPDDEPTRTMAVEFFVENSSLF